MMSSEKDLSLCACTKCHTRHPFESLSKGDMVCGTCLKSITKVVCTFCREEFESSKGSSSHSICRKCQSNVKQYGKPNACMHCNIVAAFIGNKCQRCANSEKKWGAPQTCDQCKQKSAFMRDRESRSKVDGRTLCWLCTLTYKKVQARARKKAKEQRATTQALLKPKSAVLLSSAGNKAKMAVSSSAAAVASKRRRSSSGVHKAGDEKGHHHHRHHDKRSRSGAGGDRITASSSNNGTGVTKRDLMHLEPVASESIIATSQLRDEVDQLKRQLVQKDQLLREREIKLTELKAHHYESEKELRGKMASMQTEHNAAIQNLQAKNAELLRQIASAKKAGKKSGFSAAAAAAVGADIISASRSASPAV